MASWSDCFWESNDGLRLHYRDYAGDTSRPPIICIPGLTRNARDFEGVAERLAGDWRVICVDLRGRGESAYAQDPMTYMPPVYVQDLEALFAQLELDRFILFGTSLGGLITMLLSMTDDARIAGALLNDIGPVLDLSGLDRIRSYVGRSQSWPTWIHAARHFSEAQHDVYPEWGLDQWLVFAKRLCKVGASGRIVFDYDMRIAEPFKMPIEGGPIDLWPALAGLKEVPTLAVRGALSDLLSAETLKQMKAEMPLMDSVTIPHVGHAPTLDEPEAVKATARLLARIEGKPKRKRAAAAS